MLSKVVGRGLFFYLQKTGIILLVEIKYWGGATKMSKI